MKKKQNTRSARNPRANKKAHLTYEERVQIEGYISAGLTYEHIARALGRGASTIHGEIRRNKGWCGYRAQSAHHRAYLRQYRKKRDCNRVAVNVFLKRFIERALRLGWSPERIASRLRYLKGSQSSIAYASAKSIRKYIQKRPGLETFLYHRRMKKKSGRKRGSWLKDTTRRFVDSMPKKEGFGTFEVDFIVSSFSSSVVLVLVDVATKLTLLRVLPNRINTEVNEAIVEMLAPYEAHTLVPDNDIAFTQWEKLAAETNTDIYFARPYCSTDKPLVENTNKWLRMFISKKSDLTHVTRRFVSEVEEWFNYTPRECLGGMSPFEAYEKEMGRDRVQKTYPQHPLLSPLEAMPFVFGGRGAQIGLTI